MCGMCRQLALYGGEVPGEDEGTDLGGSLLSSGVVETDAPASFRPGRPAEHEPVNLRAELAAMGYQLGGM